MIKRTFQNSTEIMVKGTFLSISAEVFVITPTDEHFSSLKLKIGILVTENCLEIEDVLELEAQRLAKARRPPLAG